MISYFIWNGSPELFSLGPITLRWYGLLFALGFLISQQILYYMHRKEGKPEKDVDTLTIYMVIATLIGARLGHVIFYQPEMIWENPLGIFLPFEFSPFRFIGLQGLASHGGAIGILFALWLYSRKKKPGQNYMQVLDRIVILVALTGCLIRLGNFFNSEIIGKPTNSPLGVVFVSKVTETIMRNDNGNNPVAQMVIKKDNETPFDNNGFAPLHIYFFFKAGITEPLAQNFLEGDVKFYLTQLREFVNESGALALRYQMIPQADGTFAAKVHTYGVNRHPAQLYESISCLILFLLLFWIWTIKKEKTPTGMIFGIFMIILWSLRFCYEFLKENQVPFEDQLPLNMGQILSIPLILVGIAVLVWSIRNKQQEEKIVE